MAIFKGSNSIKDPINFSYIGAAKESNKIMAEFSEKFKNELLLQIQPQIRELSIELGNMRDKERALISDINESFSVFKTDHDPNPFPPSKESETFMDAGTQDAEAKKISQGFTLFPETGKSESNASLPEPNAPEVSVSASSGR